MTMYFVTVCLALLSAFLSVSKANEAVHDLAEGDYLLGTQTVFLSQGQFFSVSAADFAAKMNQLTLMSHGATGWLGPANSVYSEKLLFETAPECRGAITGSAGAFVPANDIDPVTCVTYWGMLYYLEKLNAEDTNPDLYYDLPTAAEVMAMSPGANALAKDGFLLRSDIEELYAANPSNPHFK